MRDTNPLRLALGLSAPWIVTKADFDAEARRLDIHIDFPPGVRFVCPSCGATDCPAHDSSAKTWRHLNFFQHQAFLHARVPRVRRDRCGVKRTEVPRARPDSGFTLLFEALIMALVSAMPVAAAARMIGEHDTRSWRVLHHYVEQARARLDTAAVTRVAIDETAAHRGHAYVPLFVDIDCPPVRRHRLFPCSSTSTRRASSTSPKARMPPLSPRSPRTWPRMAAILTPSRRFAST